MSVLVKIENESSELDIEETKYSMDIVENGILWRPTDTIKCEWDTNSEIFPEDAPCSTNDYEEYIEVEGFIVNRKNWESNVEEFSCSHCAFNTAQKHLLISHFTTRHSHEYRRSIERTSDLGRSQELCWLKCEHCVFRTKSAFILQEHMLCDHIPAGSSPTLHSPEPSTHSVQTKESSEKEQSCNEKPENQLRLFADISVNNLADLQAMDSCLLEEDTEAIGKVAGSATSAPNDQQHNDAESPILSRNPTNDPTSKLQKSKGSYCIFCRKNIIHISRHFICRHHEEPEVQAISLLNKRSRKRKNLLQRLRNRGKFELNRTLEDSKLERPVHKWEVVSCPICKRFFTGKSITLHRMTCFSIENERELMSFVHPVANQVLREEIIPTMTKDSVFKVLRKDKLIILLGNHLVPIYPGNQQYLIQDKMRSAAKLFTIVRNRLSTIDQFSDLFQPKYFKDMIEAMLEFAEYDSRTNTFQTPSMALEVLSIVQTCCEVLKQAAFEGIETVVEGIESFKEMLELQADELFKQPASEAIESLSSQQTNKTDKSSGKLFISYGGSHLESFVVTETDKVWSTLQNSGFNYDDWLKLNELCLLRLGICNQMLITELGKAKITDFKTIRKLSDETSLDMQKITLGEIDLPEIIYEMVLNCSSSKVFLSKAIKEYLDYIIDHRKRANIQENNPYLFAIAKMKNGNRFWSLDPHGLFKKYSLLCNTSTPSKISRFHLKTELKKKLPGKRKCQLKSPYQENQDAKKELYVLLERLPVNSEQRGASKQSSDEDYLLSLSSEGSDSDSCDGIQSEYIPRERWDSASRELMHQLFDSYISAGIFPPGEKIHKAIRKYPQLANRSPAKIRSFLQYVKKKKAN